MIKPFIKWAGGKSQIIDKLFENLPSNIKESKKINKYIEPFIGGGSFYFYLNSVCNVDKNIINDISFELINTYITLAHYKRSLSIKLELLHKDYNSFNDDRRREFYNKKRLEYNNLINHVKKCGFKTPGSIQLSSLFIFLNKTCFNGLYRVNSKGLFNVPIGKYKICNIYNKNNLFNANKILKKTKMYNTDFSQLIKYVEKDDFIYLDPPYRPLNKTSDFTSYNSNSFDDNAQIRLYEFFRQCDQIGAYVMLSNSDPKNTDDNDNFFDYLYKDFNIIRIDAKRKINCNSKKRGNIKELLIMNY